MLLGSLFVKWWEIRGNHKLVEPAHKSSYTVSVLYIYLLRNIVFCHFGCVHLVHTLYYLIEPPSTDSYKQTLVSHEHSHIHVKTKFLTSSGHDP